MEGLNSVLPITPSSGLVGFGSVSVAAADGQNLDKGVGAAQEEHGHSLGPVARSDIRPSSA